MIDIAGDDMSIQVLLVEDSPGDVRLTKEAFRDANMSITLHVASDGVEAMAFLRNEGGYQESPRPDLILLDLNLPRMDGREVLAQVKADDSLKTIPTVILTTSEAEADIAKSYQLQANCYLSKPVQFDAFEGLVKSITTSGLSGPSCRRRGKADEQEIDRQTPPHRRSAGRRAAAPRDVQRARRPHHRTEVCAEHG
jgi:CheY-like chemotaxis protein